MVRAHRGDQNLLRHVEEAFVELADQRHRPFDEARDFVGQTVIFDEFEVLRVRELLGVMQDLRLAVGRGQDHVGALQLLDVVFEAAGFKFVVAEEAVAAASVARADGADFERHDFAVEGCEDRMQRAHPGEVARAPTLRLRPRERFDDVRDQLGEDGGRGSALAFGHREIEVAFRVLLDLKLIFAQARRAQEALDRGVGRVDLGAFAFFRDVGLLRGEAFDHEREPARRRERARAFVQEAAVGEAADDQAFEIARGLRLHARGDFFGEDFEEELGHGAYRIPLMPAPTVMPCGLSIQACAHSLASARTRPI